jgi:hypothetical protein
VVVVGGGQWVSGGGRRGWRRSARGSRTRPIGEEARRGLGVEAAARRRGGVGRSRRHCLAPDWPSSDPSLEGDGAGRAVPVPAGRSQAVGARGAPGSQSRRRSYPQHRPRRWPSETARDPRGDSPSRVSRQRARDRDVQSVRRPLGSAPSTPEPRHPVPRELVSAVRGEAAPRGQPAKERPEEAGGRAPGTPVESSRLSRPRH